MDNHEFFMEASKNPDIKARKRTVKNLRKLGVDRAHEVDNRKINDKWMNQLNELDKKYLNQEISPEDYLKQSKEIKNQMRSLTQNGIDIQIKDSYGKKHKTKLMSNYGGDSYKPDDDVINIDPETMNSNKFYSAFTHEAGHTEQHKRFGLDKDDIENYTASNTDDYPIKCAKLFLQKNKDKMNSHDALWTELHADFLAAKKSGFNKQIKDIHTFKRSNKRIKNDIKESIKHNEEMFGKIKSIYLRYKDDDDKIRTASEKDVEECINLYKQAKEKIEHYHDILQKRTKDIFDTLLKSGSADTARTDKLVKLYEKASKREKDIASKLWSFEREFKHKGFSVKDALAYGMRMEAQIKEYNNDLEDLYAEFTTHDYRIKFLEDMKHIHEGHPERCSMKYPTMTPADKKYMQEFTVEEMYLSNIITESEYLQLQERIQILTERSE